MFKRYAALVAIGFLCVMAGAQTKPPAQEVQKHYSYTFVNGVGTCILKGVSLDEVWSAAVKALMGDKFKIVSSEKQSGHMAAERRPFAATNYGLTLFFEQKGTDICVTTSIYMLPGQQQEGIGGLLRGIGAKGAAHKEEKKFYDRVAALLYGKIEKK